MLIEKLGAVIRAWDETFSQRRTFERAAVHSVADLCVAGRHTHSHGICYLGRQHAASALLLAGMQAYGHVKPDQISTDRAWYRHKKRITIGDLVHILRSELQNVPPEQRSQYIMDIIQDKIKPNTVMQNVQT